MLGINDNGHTWSCGSCESCESCLMKVGEATPLRSPFILLSTHVFFFYYLAAHASSAHSLTILVHFHQTTLLGNRIAGQHAEAAGSTSLQAKTILYLAVISSFGRYEYAPEASTPKNLWKPQLLLEHVAHFTKSHVLANLFLWKNYNILQL